MASERRMIHARTWKDQWFGSLSMTNRLLWIGLLTACADDQGRFPAIPAIIRSEVFPYDDIALSEIAAGLDAFVAAGRLHAYEIAGRQLYQVVYWWRYQTPAWAEPSTYPAPQNWVDRCRYHLRGKPGIGMLNWDKPGGFLPEPSAPQLPDPQPASLPTPLRSDLRTPQPCALDTPLPTPLSSATNKIRQDKIRQDKTRGVKKQQELTRAPSESPLPPPDSAAAADPSPPPILTQEKWGEAGRGVYPQTPLEASHDPDIGLFRQAAGAFPGQSQYKTVVDTVRMLRRAHPGEDLLAYLARYLSAWTARTNARGQPYDPLNLVWLTEWALNGQIPPLPAAKSKPPGGARARLAAELNLNPGGPNGD